MPKGFLPKVVDHLRYRWGMLVNSGDKFYRSLNPEHHQLTSTTSSRRYPELFGELQRIVGPGPVRILSFGCSTGEECFSIAEYFPMATIIGADINKANLAQARKQNVLPQVTFIHSSPEAIKNAGIFDMILCLSVLCRWEDTKDLEDCSRIYPFEKFEAVTGMLTDNLREGGHLVIYNSNFRFEESLAYRNRKFDIVATPAVADSGFVHKFDSGNKRVRETHTACVYRKGKHFEQSTR
jgi:SAM-dependent methyltransferase